MSLDNNAVCFFNLVNSLFSVVVCACVILYVKPMIDNYSLSCELCRFQQLSLWR